MMLKLAVMLMTLASLAAGCGQAGSSTVSQADTCTQSGGVWRPALGMCDRSAGGGGY
jgi:hypothetical protein